MAQCRLSPSSVGTAAGSPRTLPLTAASDGVFVRLQELAGSGRLCRPGQARRPVGGGRHQG
eukprot:8060441-Alexandrium_andersonii.AAC.1